MVRDNSCQGLKVGWKAEYTFWNLETPGIVPSRQTVQINSMLLAINTEQPAAIRRDMPFMTDGLAIGHSRWYYGTRVHNLVSYQKVAP